MKHILLLLALACCKAPETVMIEIPAGTYRVRCIADAIRSCRSDRDHYVVTTKTFEIDQTEVTIAQYKACIDASACADYEQRSTETEPVQVSYANAEMYCRWQHKELPYFVHWEIAARGKRGGNYPWGNGAPTCADIEYSGCLQHKELEPVGSRPFDRSEFGVLDLWGSSSEWVASDHELHRMRPSVIHRPPAEQHVYGADEEFSLHRTPTGFRCARGQTVPVIVPIDE